MEEQEKEKEKEDARETEQTDMPARASVYTD